MRYNRRPSTRVESEIWPVLEDVNLTRMIKWPIGVAALLFLVACNLIGGDEDTESGISGDGVKLKNIQTEVGDGSNKVWSSACMIVQGKTESKFRSKYAFHIDEPSDWDPDLDDRVEITLIKLDKCEIRNCTLDSCPESSKIAYTTENWLCVGDYVKVNGNDCLITAIDSP